MNCITSWTDDHPNGSSDLDKSSPLSEWSFCQSLLWSCHLVKIRRLHTWMSFISKSSDNHPHNVKSLETKPPTMHNVKTKTKWYSPHDWINYFLLHHPLGGWCPATSSNLHNNIPLAPSSLSLMVILPALQTSKWMTHHYNYLSIQAPLSDCSTLGS